MNKVKVHFYDKEDNGHYYAIGSPYPRKGVEVTKKRLKHLIDKGFVQGEDLPLADKTVKELRELAEEKQVDVSDIKRKDDIIEALEK